MDMNDLAKSLFNSKRAEGASSVSNAKTVQGTVVEDSEDGSVKVVIDGDVIAADGTNEVEIGTVASLKEGDETIILLEGGGVMRPTAIGSVGWGDRISADIIEANQLIVGAQEDIATETAARKAVYGTCATAAGTAAKEVVCDGFEPYTGARITVKFANASTTSAPTLAIVDSSSNVLLAAKAIWVGNSVTSSDNPLRWAANATLTFVYDGTEWVLEDKPAAYSGTCSTGATTRAKAITIAGAFIVNGTTITIRFSSANTYASNSVQLNVSSTGTASVYKNNAATSTTNTLLWSANTVMTFVRQGAGWYLTDAGLNKYVTVVDANGIQIHPSGSATDYAQINADGMDVVKGGTSVAKFGELTRIGEADKSRIELDYHSLQLVSKEDETYFHVSDLRDSSGYATIQERFLGDGTETDFKVGVKIASVTSVTIDGVAETGYTFENHDDATYHVIFTTAPADGAEIEIEYTSNSKAAKAFTFGIRDDGGVGAWSYSEGYKNISTGFTSHAEGLFTKAYGSCSHAEGQGCVALIGESHAQGYYTVASGWCQTVIGRYNAPDVYYPFIVGNGRADDDRSNALRLNWDGKLYIADGRGSLQRVMTSKVVLYNDSTGTGTNGTVSLTASASNYNHMRIYFYALGGGSSFVKQHSSVDVYEPNGKYVALSAVGPGYSGATQIDFRTKLALISGSQITNVKALAGTAFSGQGVYNEVYITRVEAWNE